MVRKISLLFAVSFVFLLMACTTTSMASINGSYPKNTSDGQCVITFGSSTIQYFDGTLVDWDAYNPIVIPAGTHTISTSNAQYRLPLEYNRSVSFDGRTITTRETYIPYTVSYRVTYDFQKGKEYRIRVHPWEVTYDRKTGELIATGGAIINISASSFEIIPKVEIIEVEERDTTAIGNLVVAPESTWLLEAGMGFGGIRLFPLGYRGGISFLGGRTDIKLVGLGQFGFFFPINGSGFFGYNFGGLMEFHFPSVEIGLGGGMGGGLVSYKKGGDGQFIDYEFTLEPYIELNLGIRKNPGSLYHSIYFHYYPSFGDEWFKTIGFGYKFSAFKYGGGGAAYHSNVNAIN